jgi:hypothetical protein
MPIIKGAASFPTSTTLGMLDGDQYQAGGVLKFSATNVFYRQIRNIIFDTTDIPGKAVAIHWPSSQATSIQNCIFHLSQRAGDTHTGLFIEEGSGGFLNDLIFYGGQYGAQLGNQQYTMRNLSFIGSKVGIQQLWDWGWTYKSLKFQNCGVGIDMSTTDVGSVTLIDSTFTQVNRALIVARRPPAANAGRGSIVIEGNKYVQVPVLMAYNDGTVVLAGSLTKTIDGPGWIRVSLSFLY